MCLYHRWSNSFSPLFTCITFLKIWYLIKISIYVFPGVLCPDLQPISRSSQYIIFENRQYSYPDIAQFSCNVGYKIVGPKIINCQHTGKWSALVPKCESKYSLLLQLCHYQYNNGQYKKPPPWPSW